MWGMYLLTHVEPGFLPSVSKIHSKSEEEIHKSEMWQKIILKNHLYKYNKSAMLIIKINDNCMWSIMI